MKARISFTLLIYFLLVSDAQAGMVEFNFQGQINNGTIPIGTLLTNQYADDGITFQIEAITNTSVTRPVADGFGSNDTRGLFNTFNPDTPIIATFSVLINTIAYSSIAGFPLSVRVYDSDDNEIGYSNISDGTMIGSLVTTSFIKFIELYNDSGTGYLGLKEITTVSYLRYGTDTLTPVTATPLPAGLLLFSSSLFIFFGLMTRQNNLQRT